MIVNAAPQWTPSLPAWLAATIDFAMANRQAVLIGAGAVAALLAVVMLRKFLRTGEAHQKLGRIAIVLATALAMEGMYEVARHRLALTIALAVIFCATFEVLAAWLGAYAAFKRKKNPNADISRYMNGLWAIAVISGVIASTAGNNITEVLLRLVSPCAAGVVWWVNLAADQPDTVHQQRSTWVWTPRAIGIRLGLIRAGEQDLVVVAREHRINALLRVVIAMDTATMRRAGKLAVQLRRLMADADPEMVTEVAERYQRSTNAQELIFGRVRVAVQDKLTAAVTSVPAAWWEALLPWGRVRRLDTALATQKVIWDTALAAAHAETERVSGSLTEMTALFETASDEAQRESERATQALAAQRTAEQATADARREFEGERSAAAAQLAAARAEAGELADRVRDLDRELAEARTLADHTDQTAADLRARLADQAELHRRELAAEIGRMCAERDAAVATARVEATTEALAAMSTAHRATPAPAQRRERVSGKAPTNSGPSPEWTEQQLTAFRLRDHDHLTTEQIADRLSVGVSTVGRWFTHRRKAGISAAPAVPTLPFAAPAEPVTAGTNGAPVNADAR